MSQEELLQSIDQRLQALVVLTAASTLEGLTQAEKIERLLNLGFEPLQISSMTGLPSTTVSPIASRLRKGAAAASRGRKRND